MVTNRKYTEPKILVVDDSKSTRNMYISILQKRSGWEVVAAASAEEAIVLVKGAEQAGNPFDIVISDWHMDQKSGLELLRDIKSESSLQSTKVMLVTSENNFANIQEAIDAGANEFVIKPINEPKLLGKVDGLLKRGISQETHLEGSDIGSESLQAPLNASQVVKDESQYLQTVFSTMSDLLVVVDRQKRILSVNQKFSQLIDVSLDRVMGENFFKFVDGTFEEKQALWNELISGSVKDVHMLLIDRDHNLVPVLVSGSRILGSEDDQHVFCAKDISQEVKLQNKLFESAKMASLGKLAGGVAHEINNPLMIIQGYTEHLIKMVGSQKWDQKQFEIISKKIVGTVERISSIVRGLRAFARDGRQDKMKLVNVKNIVEDTLEFCQKKLEYNQVKLLVNYPHEDFYIKCRPIQISQVLLNLINNSYDAIQDVNERWIEIGIGFNPESVFIYVMDSGIGIPESERSKVFEPFYTKKDENVGTGLGLSISHSIMKSHNAEIFLDPSENRTKFVLSFPRQIQEKKVS